MLLARQSNAFACVRQGVGRVRTVAVSPLLRPPTLSGLFGVHAPLRFCSSASPHSHHHTHKRDKHSHKHGHSHSHAHAKPDKESTRGPTTEVDPEDHWLTVAQLVDRVALSLPAQGILENFVHHNPLEHLEHLPWPEALHLVHEQESYMSPAARIKAMTEIAPQKRVNEVLTELASAFLDRGAAKWTAKFRDRGFLYFFASLENTPGVGPWRRSARKTATKILAQLDAMPKEENTKQGGTALCEKIIEDNLKFFGVPREEWEDCIRSMLLELRGWAGMFRRMETHPAEVPEGAVVRLIDFAAAQSVLYRASVEAVARGFGWSPANEPFSKWIGDAPSKRSLAYNPAPPQHTSALAFVDQNPEAQAELEAEFEHAMLRVVNNRTNTRDSFGTHTTTIDAQSQSQAEAQTQTEAEPQTKRRPSLQVYTCIDDREGSFRRHIEEADTSSDNPNDKDNDSESMRIETFGVAGFFGVPVKYKPVDGREVMILAPEGQNPQAVLVEAEDEHHPGEVSRFKKGQRLVANLKRLWENASFSPFGSVLLSSVAPLSLGRLWLMGYAPEVKMKLRQKLQRMALGIPKPHTDFVLPFPAEQAAAMLANTFKDLGTDRSFAPLVVVVGHGATSVNNPFAAAYQCGACGGREGGPNARLFARIANDKSVREELRRKHNVDIPQDTFFVGGFHNTTNDTVEFFDIDRLPAKHRNVHWPKAEQILQTATAQNALERCHRFLLAHNVQSYADALKHVFIRSADPAELRPELNHATNAAVVVGRRSLTRGSFLDRRVFLPSYDPTKDDDRGTNLERVLAPALIVCSGINLEYLFSTVDVEHHGAGTKVPLNVVSNIGVIQGTSGDLRPGLPTQMTEMHVPVRALYVIDAPVARVEAVLQRREQLRRLVHNEWVRFFVRDPTTEQYFRLANGQCVPVAIPPHDTSQLSIPFRQHRAYGLSITSHEDTVYWCSSAAMVAACVGPIAHAWGHTMLNPYGALVAICGTALALPVLAFSRRYMHGEFMFTRFAALSTTLLLGFNLVATAPTLVHLMAGWSLFGFASTFLIGAYNDRPTVRNNATFAFSVYKVSDLALLVAATFASQHALTHGFSHPSVVAAGLILAAIYKSSQFPLANLFVRSMEGPTPASALGYAGLSAHVGVVLLAGTMNLWYPLAWTHWVLGGIGAYTALFGSIKGKIYSDRKGAVARATSATLGLIFIILALGFPKIALCASFGHAAFRMIQILRAPNIISDTQSIVSALGRAPWPKKVPDSLYRLAWTLRRFDQDFTGTPLHALAWIMSKLGLDKRRMNLNKAQQWAVTTVCVVLAGLPFTPLMHWFEELLMEMLPHEPALAGLLMAGHFAISVILIRFVFVKVLSPRRFWSFDDPHRHAIKHHHPHASHHKQPPGTGPSRVAGHGHLHHDLAQPGSWA